MHWYLTFDNLEYTLRLVRIEVLFGLDNEALIRLEPDRFHETPDLLPHQHAELRIFETDIERPSSILPLSIDSLGGRDSGFFGQEGSAKSIAQTGICLNARMRKDQYREKALSNAEGMLSVVQKQESETLAGFINRCGLSGELAEATGEDGDIEVFGRAFSQGCCIMARPGDGPEDMEEKVFGLLRRRTSCIVGRSRGLHVGRYRIRTFTPRTNDPNWYFDAKQEDGWKLRSTFDGRCRIVAQIGTKDLAKAFLELQDPEMKTLKVQSADVSDRIYRFPVLPTTVKAGGSSFFCHRLLYRFMPDSDESEINLEVELDLSEIAAKYPFATDNDQSRFLLGVFEGWLESEVGAGRLIRVAPPYADDIAEPELKPMARWLIDGSEHLLACLIAPGFSRQEYSGFYARFKPGDLVLVGLTNGGFPQVFGSLQVRRDEFEDDQSPEVSLRGSMIDIAAVNDDGSSANTGLSISREGELGAVAEKSLSIESENISMSGEKLSMLETLVVKKNEAKIRGKMNVKGEIEVS